MQPAPALTGLAVAAVVSFVAAPRPAQADDDTSIAQVVRDISAQRIEAIDRKLVSFGTRHTLSDTKSDMRGIGAARRWIYAELQKCSKESGGRLQVSLDDFIAPPQPRIPAATQLVNVVATLPGTQPESKARIYVVSGHYDSRATDIMDSTSDAPGADDDGSGAAAAMEMACVMSHYKFDATLVFMTVAGEEQGLVGAKHWAQAARAKDLDVAGMITNDIIGSSHADDGRVDADRVRLFAEGVPVRGPLSDERKTIIRTGGENDLPTRELARFIKEQAEANVPAMTVEMIYRTDRYLRGGDHSAFLAEGYPAVRFTEPHEDYRHQHQDVRDVDGVQYGDLPRYVDYTYLANVTRVNAAALAALALGPAAPKDVQMETEQLENNTTLRWAPNTEPDLAGYQVLWRRTTSPVWEHRQDVGNVTRYTMKGLSKDNYIFGVAAVDKDGHPSVAVYPTPYLGK